MDLNKLNGLVPDEVIEELHVIQDKFGVNTSMRLAHFLGQCAHESGNFKFTNENLNYRANSLKAVFGKYFPTDELAAQYEHKPEKIANRVYASRMGNGDEASGDGYKFHGRGFIQLTGKENYAKFSAFIGEDCVANPDLVASKYPLASAAFFFSKNNLWATCDRGSTDQVVTDVTRAVNGGVNGLADRTAYFHKFFNALSVPEHV